MLKKVENTFNFFKNNNSFIVILEKILISGFRFISLFFIIKLFGSSGQGVFSYVNTIWSILLVLFLFGFDVSIIYYVSKKTDGTLSDVINNSVLFLFTAIIISFITLALLENFSPIFDKLPKNYMYLFYGGMVIFLIRQILRGILYGLGKFHLQVYGMFIIEIGFSLLVLIFYIFNLNNIELLLIFYLSLNFLASIIWCFQINKEDWKYKFYFDTQLLKNQIDYGLKVYVNSIILSLNLRFDAFIIIYILSEKNYAYYAIAVVFSEVVTYLPLAMSTLILNKISHRNEGYNLNMFPVFMAFMISAAVLIGIIGVLFIPIAYGDEYKSSIIPFIILLFGALPMGFNTISSYFLLGINQGNKLIISSIFSLFTIIILDLILIPHYGIIGAAIASLISYSLSALITIKFLFQFSNEHEKSKYLYLIPSFKGAYLLLKNKLSI